jgi:hypothetical protein
MQEYYLPLNRNQIKSFSIKIESLESNFIIEVV